MRDAELRPRSRLSGTGDGRPHRHAEVGHSTWTAEWALKNCCQRLVLPRRQARVGGLYWLNFLNRHDDPRGCQLLGVFREEAVSSPSRPFPRGSQATLCLRPPVRAVVMGLTFASGAGVVAFEDRARGMDISPQVFSCFVRVLQDHGDPSSPFHGVYTVGPVVHASTLVSPSTPRGSVGRTQVGIRLRTLARCSGLCRTSGSGRGDPLSSQDLRPEPLGGASLGFL